MVEWLYETGIGENRAALVDQGVIVEACVEPENAEPRAGAIISARLRANRIAALEDGSEALLDYVPKGLCEGARMMVEITREALSETGKPKRAKARPAPLTSVVGRGPTLLERITATDIPVRLLSAVMPDALELAGWSERLEEAQSGETSFHGGALRISLTPAMTLIDVDGTLDPASLALAGTRAAAAAIRLFGLCGSIGIDLPTLGGKAERVACAEAFDALLPLPFERTAVNGFGLMQVVRPRHRASLCELVQSDPAAAAARALLRRVERSGMTGLVTLVAPAAVERIICAHPHWTDQLARILGGAVSLRVDPSLSIAGAYAERSPL
ncbi:MAG: ribonuclease [Chakrabartia sp.]